MEARIINKVYSRTYLEDYPVNLQRAFLEMAVCLENQRLVPKEKDDIWINNISKITKSLKNQFDKLSERKDETKRV